MTSISKNMSIDKVHDIVNKYKNRYYRTFKMKPADVKDNTHIDFGKESNNKDPTFKIGDHVKISKQKNVFAKCYTTSWSEEVFIIKKVLGILFYAINDLNGEETIGTFYEKEQQKTNQGEFRIETVIKKKDDKRYVKWKGCGISFNSWVDEKDIA